MKTGRVVGCAVVLAVLSAVQPWRLGAEAQAVQPAKGVKYARVLQSDLKEWLTYLSSDALQGRQAFTEGYGLAAAYVADRLKAWGVTPAGEQSTYFQSVRMKGYRAARNSSVTVEVNGQSRTFKHGDHVTFPANAGGKQSLVFAGVEFVGYGLVNAAANHDDFRGRDVKGKLIVSVSGAPATLGQTGGRGRGAAALAVGTLGAKGAIAYVAAPVPPTPVEESVAKARAALAQATEALAQAEQSVRQGGAGAGRGARLGGPGAGRGAPTPADFTTVLNVDSPVAPQITADDVFYELLFSGGPTPFAEIKAKASKGEVIAGFSLPGVRVRFNIDHAYETVSAQMTKNVVGMVPGSDPTLKDTYVLFGAHLDHIGYSQAGLGNGPAPGACRQRGPASLDALAKAGKTPQNPGRRGGGAPPPAGLAPARGASGGAPAPPPGPFDTRDAIYNGADDDGSGSVALMGIAKAFATGPKPKRTVVFIWHAAEESGLQGSRFNADFPAVPLDRIQAHFNMDMVGRDDCNNVEGDYTNSVFIVGADRISTDLHNLIVAANAGSSQPLTLDYELNDPNDPESVYTRSDHYSYASKGIPVAFFTTGLHPDYHRVSDTVDKIVFPKMARIAELIYQAGFSVANADRVLERDNKGARTGFGSKAETLK